ncbi:small ribosomal subunit biogenesis GTPase RsgA 1, mitochondrial [Abrus precatorius]|uniref:Small ribosomal subunit biogenesis GTPase RsgA 1, mitochondrial n=1 Tax=Abrus precatorius TaxID=3816 RepID=A0A8B8JVP4_ABRPR|nr:small ribosomal subunit biogenesis GTPase RsgA 1, mitochondrial [Abrus precatorius]XP_027335592.1 small ribosomal subunit biogenesis GTPase RsgA 1, mitochondrial [Abrus precatorius]
MSLASFSMLRHRAVASAAPLLLRRFRCFSIAAGQQNPNKHQQAALSKNLWKAKQTLKEYSSLAPVLSLEDNPPLSESQAIGVVAASQANFMRVIVPEEGSGSFHGVEILCVVRALLKKIKRRVMVGDKVLVGSVDWVDRRGMIENVFQRSSEILDPPVANVDHLLVLFSLDQPKVEPFTLTRFLVEAESTGIPLTLALNKIELVDKETVDSWKARVRGWGYEPVLCSVESGYGLDLLAFKLRDQTTVIVGPSGVGKSSLINALRSNPRVSDAAEGENWFEPILGSKWLEDQRVGEVSTRSGRGKHTTRHVSLLPLSGGGFLADTPGFNQPSLLKVTKQSLAQTFPEIRKALSTDKPAKCAFNNCLHVGEPGCIVKGDWERYSFYFQLLDEIRIREEFQLRTFGTKREGDVRLKMGDMGVQQAEPRLEPKKHRRQSRKRINQSILDELNDDDDLIDEENDPVLRALRNENS